MKVPITTDIAQAVKILREGRVVAFPTGTSYGLAVDALQGHALQRLRNLKERSSEKTFTVYMRPALWEKYLTLTEQERSVLEKMNNKPLTLLVSPRSELQHLAQNGRVGVRIIDHSLMEQLAEALDVPLTATSANKGSREPCFSPACIQKTFPWQLDDNTHDLSLGCILDGGELPQRLSTTIAQIENGKIIIVRQGELKTVEL
jgi:L-threonylcarbamoyladenylate synthase